MRRGRVRGCGGVVQVDRKGFEVEGDHGGADTARSGKVGYCGLVLRCGLPFDSTRTAQLRGSLLREEGIPTTTAEGERRWADVQGGWS